VDALKQIGTELRHREVLIRVVLQKTAIPKEGVRLVESNERNPRSEGLISAFLLRLKTEAFVLIERKHAFEVAGTETIVEDAQVRTDNLLTEEQPRDLVDRCLRVEFP